MPSQLPRHPINTDIVPVYATFRNCFRNIPVFTMSVLHSFTTRSGSECNLHALWQAQSYYFLHKYAPSVLCFIFLDVAGFSISLFWHPKPIFREYFLWAFAPLAVFLLMLFLLLYIFLYRITLQHFLQERTTRSYLSGNALQLLLFPQITALLFLLPCHAPTWTEDFSCHHRLLLLSVQNVWRNIYLVFWKMEQQLSSAARIPLRMQLLSNANSSDIRFLMMSALSDLMICQSVAYTSPPLTTIRQDRIELGKSGFFALSSLLNGVSISTFLLHTQLIERGNLQEMFL